ncbi:T9SS type B sorting domain-containing protein [Mangrovimonas cancribranchiae]|uniref:T9SS type B sorting domain-containing protein n=1 Tax=Mangrovimonas cancribranchiae TaxID=3080055 RepID=A0AAU6P825_9FLAO
MLKASFNIAILKLKFYLALLTMLFSVFISFAQLPDFTLNVTSIDETCSGNGAIQMSVSNTTSGSEIVYTLYAFPDIGTPIAQTSNNIFNNLNSGDYRVIATQTLEPDENSAQQDVSISNLTTELDFEITQNTVNNCDTIGSLIVNVTSGNPVSFEIISGPVTTNVQTSNEFNNLPEGTYIIRVFDDCDNALTKTYTLILNTNDIEISDGVIPSIHSSCTEINLSNSLSSSTENPIIYPLDITYTIFPPNGSPTFTVTQTITSGAEHHIDILQTIPLYGDQVFNVDILITDSCGDEFSNSNEINPNPTVELLPYDAFCGYHLNLMIDNFMPPYTVDFIEAPPEFIANEYNSTYPGPFSEPSIFFQITNTPIPFGYYSVLVTDACGNTAEYSIVLEEELPEPDVDAANSGCSVNGTINISIPDRDIVSVIFTAAPNTYPNTLPDNVSSFIENGVFSMDNLPSGNYSLTLIDECGGEHIIDTTVPEFSFRELSIINRADCSTNTGSIRIASGHENIASITITSAPNNYNENIPHNISHLINGQGAIVLNNLTSGDYAFEIIDECGFEYFPNIYINSYISTPNAYTLNRNCGSFDVGVLDPDDSVTNKSYWFQKFFPETDSWGHPYTEELYTEGDIPNPDTAIEIENEETLYNIFLTGTFRIIKVFQSFNDVNTDDFCLDFFTNFDIYSDLTVSGIYNLGCEGGTGPSDVLIDVAGIEPYNFSIISPYSFDNGENNIFSNLAAGIYEIEVEDACGNIENAVINIEDLLPVVNIYTPDNMFTCSNESTSPTFALTNQNSQILGNQNPENFTVTYHLNQTDADSGDNPLPENYTNISNPQTIYTRVIHNSLNICHATTSFQLNVGEIPDFNADENISVCDGSTITLNAISGYDTYEWSTGETTQNITVNESGTYTVSVKTLYGDNFCESTQTFTVTSSSIATFENIDISDWTSNNNAFTITVSGNGDYVYSIDNINYQEENIFTGLEPGVYTVFVKDLNNCGIISEDISLLNHPHFFTPNNDGYNDYWQINESQTEPNLEVVVFDRYGKILSSFNGNSIGWDGTYNGNNMPTNDYWFLVKREDGTTHKGHFTLKR